MVKAHLSLIPTADAVAPRCTAKMERTGLFDNVELNMPKSPAAYICLEVLGLMRSPSGPESLGGSQDMNHLDLGLDLFEMLEKVV